MDRYLIKIGGSVITDINQEAKANVSEIKRILNEIKSSIINKEIIIGHGSGSFGHISAHKYKINLGLVNKDSVFGSSVTQNAAAKLHRIVIENAIDLGMTPFSFAPSSSAVSENGIIKNWDLSAMINALEKGFIPITYGDLIIDRKQGVSIGSTEEVFRYISNSIKPKKIIIGTDVDGIFNADPKLDKSAELIINVNNKNIDEVLQKSSGSRKIDVTGGMKSKVMHLYNISKETGAVCQIVNVKVKDRLREAILGKEVISTLIKAD
ncbi:MAG: isopentenyl phosphate kinase [Candidatus Micrarchaeia archaeon]